MTTYFQAGYLFMVNLNRRRWRAPGPPRQPAARDGEDDIAFFISRSGQTPELIEAAQLAKAQGATVISMCPVKTGLAKKSDLVIVLNTDEHRTQNKPAMLTRILQLALVDVISVGLAMRTGVVLTT